MLPAAFAALSALFRLERPAGRFRPSGARAGSWRKSPRPAPPWSRPETDRDALERRVTGLRGDRIDRDQLDERARTLLNLVGKDEIVIPYEPGKRLFR